MAFLKHKNKCDNCGKDLSDVEDPVEEGKHEFCGDDCREAYNEEHEHEEDDEAEVCEFC